MQSKYAVFVLYANDTMIPNALSTLLGPSKRQEICKSNLYITQSSMLLCLAYAQIKRYQGILVHLHKSWGIHSECFINDHLKVFHPMKQIV